MPFSILFLSFFYHPEQIVEIDKRVDGKIQNTKKRVKGEGAAKKENVSKKKFQTVDYYQFIFYNLPEGLKILFNRAGKARLEWSPPYEITLYLQQAPPKNDSKRVFQPKGTKGGQRRRSNVMASAPRQHEAEDLFHEVFFGISSLKVLFNSLVFNVHIHITIRHV